MLSTFDSLNPICCKIGLNVVGKKRNITFQLVLQQCCKTSCTFKFVLPVLPKLCLYPRGAPYMKVVGMLVFSLRGVNLEFWSRLGCSWQNTIIFSRKGLF